MPVEAAIGSFFSEFSKFEMRAVGAALRVLSGDSEFVQHSERLLGLDARLKLLRRMALVRRVPEPVIAELEGLMTRARRLHAHRDDVAANLGGAYASLPAVAGVEDYAAEAIALQESLGGITRKLNQHRPVDAHREP